MSSADMSDSKFKQLNFKQSEDLSDDGTKHLVESKEDMLNGNKNNKNDNFDDIMNLFSDEETNQGNNNSKTDSVIDNKKIKIIRMSKSKKETRKKV